MIAGAGILLSSLYEGGSPHIMNDAPPQQPGFAGTTMGQHQPIRTEWWQKTPASGLGTTPVHDRRFAQRNGGREAGLHWNANLSRRPNNPLWADPAMVEGRKQHQYEWDFLTEHGPTEGMRLHRTQKTTAPRGRAYTIPTVRPEFKP